MAIEQTALELLKNKEGFELAFYVVLGALIATLYFLFPKLKDIEANQNLIKELVQNNSQANNEVVKILLSSVQKAMEKNL